MSQIVALKDRAPGFAEHPGYQLSFEPADKRVKVVFNGEVIADSSHAMILRETRLSPVYYLPRQDIRMDALEPSEHLTYCPFKGNASYWHLKVGDKTAENAVWSYETPFEEVGEIKDYMAFYWNKVDAWYEEGQEVAIETGGDSHGHANPYVDWLLREAWEAASTEQLVGRFARYLAEVGLPLWRLALIIRTLHPQLLGTAYHWRRDQDVLEEIKVPHSSLQQSSYLDSPLVPIFEGAGGIRRRMDVANPQLDFPILKDLHAEGATDYVAMPLLFSDGQTNALTLASDRPGGFTTEDLGQIYEILPVLSRLIEVHAMRHTAKTLLDTYLGAHTGLRVLDGLVKRGDGDEIPAVIWFADLRGSTVLADSLPRDDYLALLNDYFDCTAGAVLDAGGEVLKFIGDAVLAIFPVDAQAETGAPDSAAEACASALQAAREALVRLEQLNDGRRERDEAPLRFGVALHLGEVTYGNVGVAGRLDFTVIGPAINEAARLEALSKTLKQDVLLSDAFAHHVAEPLVPLGKHCLRGVSAKHEIFTPGSAPEST
jgi:class 3 adenylate cyclase/uncharacterized protein (DUF427 family)